jgi:hypothetical protein
LIKSPLANQIRYFDASLPGITPDIKKTVKAVRSLNCKYLLDNYDFVIAISGNRIGFETAPLIDLEFRYH